MHIYIINIIMILILAIIIDQLEKKQTNKKVILFLKILIILIPSVIAGLRYGIGTDYNNVYDPIYESIKDGSLVNRNRKIELGFALVNFISASFGLGLPFVMFISSLMTSFFFTMAIYKYKDKIYTPLALTIYYLLYYQASFNAVRQFLAMSLVFFGMSCLRYDEKATKDEKIHGFIIFYLCNIIAFFFHKTSIVATIIPLLNVFFIKENNWKIKAVFFTSLAIIVLNCGTIAKIFECIPFLKYYSLYLVPRENAMVTIWYFVKVVPVLLPTVLLFKSIKNDKKFKMIFYNTLLGTILLLLGYFGNFYGDRISLYFLINQIILVAYYIKLFKNYKSIEENKNSGKIGAYLKNNSKKIVVIITVLYFAFYVSYWIHDYAIENLHETIPYHTIFELKN